MRPVSLNPDIPLSSPVKSTPQLHNFPIDIEGSDSLPISALVDPCSVNENVALSRDKILFCYQTLLNTIDSLLAKRYSDFDGHTTSNCCHGIATLAWHLIQMVLEFDLNSLKKEFEQAIHYLEQHTDSTSPVPCADHAPKALVNLSCLYLLYLIKEPNALKGYRSVPQHLKALAPISTNTVTHICHSLQSLFANWAATSYDFYFQTLNESIDISGVNAAFWGKYIKSDFIRSDKRKVKYASNLFSTQIVLGYLSQSKAKVVLINDIQKKSSDQVIDRYGCLFKGDGQGGFDPLSVEELHNLQMTSQDEPVVVLGGCIFSDEVTKEALSFRMQPWLNKLTCLMLACDVFYPQFFKIGRDDEFDNSPIIPEEEILRDLMQDYSSYGTHVKNPSLYCSTHIHIASLKQVLGIVLSQDLSSLSNFSIPQSLL